MSKKSRHKSQTPPDTVVASPIVAPTEPPVENPPLSYRLPILCLTLLFLAFFGRVIFTHSDLVFRDAGGFYYPLFEYIQSQWSAGQIPLWNPYENAGVPLVAMGTSSVFYPLKALFFLPLPYDILFKSYLLLHIAFAACTMTWLARRWEMTWGPAIAAAIVYIFSAPFLFQIYNVVFLVSAAWLPLGVYFGDQLIRTYSLKHLLGLAFVLAMMVLGGDPQTAYHLGIILGVMAIMTPRTFPSIETSPSTSTWKSWSKSRVTRLASLAVAAGLAGLLTAIQILPTSELSRQAERSSSEIPTSLWQIPSYVTSSHVPSERFDTGKPPQWYDTLTGNPPPPARHYIETFAYSFSPFRVGEFFFPNCTGSNLNEDSRWLNVLKLEDSDIWNTSSYFGLFPATLVLLSFFQSRPTSRTRWLQAILILSLLASFGRFGPRYFVELFSGQLNGKLLAESNSYISMGVGGIYWFLTVALPEYNVFRYPEKWVSMTCFAAALLTGTVIQNRLSNLEALLKTLKPYWFIILGLTWLTFIVASSSWGTLLTPSPRHPSNFSAASAWLAVAQSLFHATILITLLSFLPKLCQSISPTSSSQTLMPALLIVLSLDLLIANGHWIIPVPHDLWHQRPQLANLINDAQKENPSVLPPRYYREIWLSADPQAFSDQLDSTTRSFVGQRAAGGAGTAIEIGMCNLATRSTLDLNAYTTYFDSLPMPDGTIARPRRSHDVWGTQYFVLPAQDNDRDVSLSTKALRRQWLPGGPESESNHFLPTGEPLPPAILDANNLFPELNNLRVLKNVNAYPHAWIVRDIKLIPPIDLKDRNRWVPLMQDIVYPGGVGYDLKQTGFIETNAAELSSPSTLASTNATEDSCQLIAYSPQRVDMKAQLQFSGLVVIADTYYPGWKAYTSKSGQPEIEVHIQRTNRMMRGLYLPAGQFDIRFQYEPESFWNGAYISAISWIVFLIVSAGIFIRTMSAMQTINPQEPAHSQPAT